MRRCEAGIGALGQFQGEGALHPGSAGAGEGEGGMADDAVAVLRQVDRTDVAQPAGRQHVFAHRHQRRPLRLHLGEDHAPRVAGFFQRPAKVPFIAGLHGLHRGRQDEIHADGAGGGLVDRADHRGQLRGPEFLGQALERRRVVGRLVDQNDRDGAGGGRAALAVDAVAQPEQRVDGEPREPAARSGNQHRRRGQEHGEQAGDQGSQPPMGRPVRQRP